MHAGLEPEPNCIPPFPLGMKRSYSISFGGTRKIKLNELASTKTWIKEE